MASTKEEMASDPGMGGYQQGFVQQPPPPYSPQGGYPPTNYGMAQGPNVGQPQAGQPYPGQPQTSQPYPGQPMLPPAQQVIYSSPVNMCEDSVELVCPSCRSTVRTAVRSEAGPAAYISALIIAMFGCICGCCLIPFGIDSMKVYIHTCPNCRALLGKYAGSNSMGSSRGYTTTTTTTTTRVQR